MRVSFDLTFGPMRRKALSFLSGKKLWDTIFDLSSKSNSCQCAIAYVSNTSSMNFRGGDLLIVDASDESIKGGQTSAQELQKLKSIGVQLYSCSKLHAKLYVFDDCLVVGSCNLSASSRDRLIETAVLLRDDKIRTEACDFIAGLARKSECIADDFIERIIKLPVQQSFGNEESKPVLTSSTLWRLRIPPNALSKEMKCYFHALIVAQISDLLPNQEFTLWRGSKGRDAFRAHLNAKPKRMRGGSGQYSLTEDGVDYFSSRKLDKQMVDQFLSAIKTGERSHLPESIKNVEMIPLA